MSVALGKDRALAESQLTNVNVESLNVFRLSGRQRGERVLVLLTEPAMGAWIV